MGRFETDQTKEAIPTMMTFFDRGENVDTECTRYVVEFMLEHGADGFYLTGGTGERFAMTVEEWNLVVDTIIDQVKGRAPVTVHVRSIDTKKSIKLAEHAYRAGADAIFSMPPFHWKLRAGDIYNYYRDMSESTPLPMVVYNIQLAEPIDVDLLLQLIGLPNVHGLRYTARSHNETGLIKETLDLDSMIYSGRDEMAFSSMCSDADGIIGPSYNLFPDLYKQILKKMEENDIKGGMWLQRITDEVIFVALKYDFPSVLHNLMNWHGLESGYSGRPLYNHQDSELEGLREDVRRIKDRYQVEELDISRL